jgi:hypothetical protein
VPACPNLHVMLTNNLVAVAKDLCYMKLTETNQPRVRLAVACVTATDTRHRTATTRSNTRRALACFFLVEYSQVHLVIYFANSTVPPRA